MAELLALEYLLRRDRLIVAIGLTAVVALAWLYLVTGAGMDAGMAGMSMDMPMPWSPSYAALMFVMWWGMMIAMMVPSAASMVLLFAAIKRKQAASVSPFAGAWIFLAGYLVTWASFSLVAVLAQWGLESFGLISTAMESTSAVLGGVILLAAGLYQFTPIKSACLRYCQSPVLFLSRHWRPSAAGALRMGLRHGSYCVGCCWFLMALLFICGIMNLVWIAAIPLYVASEKLLPLDQRFSRAAGVGLIVSGAIVLTRAI
jgi:predicted metal-binding membrane protein